eukprot:3543423-Rhodomonas_salina.2
MPPLSLFASATSMRESSTCPCCGVSLYASDTQLEDLASVLTKRAVLLPARGCSELDARAGVRPFLSRYQTAMRCPVLTWLVAVVCKNARDCYRIGIAISCYALSGTDMACGATRTLYMKEGRCSKYNVYLPTGTQYSMRGTNAAFCALAR